VSVCVDRQTELLMIYFITNLLFVIQFLILNSR
jgi:hypothetical protein